MALKARGQELQNERIGDVARWKNVEAGVYEIERDILARVGVSLSEVLFVDFSESVEYLSAQEQRDRDDWELEHNLITMTDIAMRQNRDLDQAAADKLIQDNIEKNTVKKPTNIVEDILSA